MTSSNSKKTGMRITISSPDGMGDFILRIPMIRALADAGHKVQIFLREPAASLAGMVFPEIELHRIEADPYHPETRKKKNPFKSDQKAISRFHPDLYVAAPFSPNLFDHVWMESNLRDIPMAGFSGSGCFVPSGEIREEGTRVEQFRIKVDVPVGLAELEKNRRLGSAILGTELPASSPQLTPDRNSLQNARTVLNHYGVGEGNYVIACVGGRSGLKMKDWGEKNWRRFFEVVLPRDGRTVLFLGNPKEAASIERIRSSVFPSVNLSTSPPPIETSLALAALSSGYVGRDSGVMHIATAVGLPVLAAYGGGHWGRFLPSSGPAVAVTQTVGCRGCDFNCIHENPLCIADIRIESMIEGWNRLQEMTSERKDVVSVIEQAAVTSDHLMDPKEVGARMCSVIGKRREMEQASPRKSGVRAFARKVTAFLSGKE
jgi:ADP-heptose:LPS heptosyltransferase